MQKLAYYDNVEQYFRKDSVQLGDLLIEIEAGTIPGSSLKQNEDTFAICHDSRFFIAGVFDGCTSLKPIDSLKNETGAHFAANFLKKNLCTINPELSLKESFISINSQLLNTSLKLEGATLSDTHTLPASSGVIVKIDANDKSVEIGNVSDSFAIVYFTNGKSEVATEDRNKAFDDGMFDLMVDLAKKEGVTNRKVREMQIFKDALVDMFTRRNNNPDGTGNGEINGEENMSMYVFTKKYYLNGIKSILIASDGIIPQGWRITDEKVRDDIYTIISNQGFEHLYSIKHKSEDDDPDWNSPRYKHSDDATGVLINI